MAGWARTAALTSVSRHRWNGASKRPTAHIRVTTTTKDMVWVGGSPAIRSTASAAPPVETTELRARPCDTVGDPAADLGPQRDCAVSCTPPSIGSDAVSALSPESIGRTKAAEIDVARVSRGLDSSVFVQVDDAEDSLGTHRALTETDL